MNDAVEKKAENVMAFPTKSPYRPETATEFLSHHKDFVENNPAPEWLQNLRQEAVQKIAEQGLPTPRLERWKYSNLSAAVKGLGGAMAATDVSYDAPSDIVYSFADVYKDAPQWLIDWQSEMPAWEDQYQDAVLWSFCNAYLRDGLLIDVPVGAVYDKPVVIDMTGHEGGFFVPRTAFRIGEGAELTIIEKHSGEGRFWNNRLTQIHVGPNAKLKHYRLQDYSAESVYTQNTHVKIDRDAQYECFNLARGAGFSRNQLHTELLGQNAECLVYGINLLDGQQIGDTTVTVEHKAPHCHSDQFIRSILRDQARGVFQGKVHVHQIAQKTDAYQMCNALLLSEGAEMNTKPELEIYADDVSCSHGATTGQLEDQALFYLRSRGLPEEEARGLLIKAFLDEVVERLSSEELQAQCKEKISAWLGY